MLLADNDADNVDDANNAKAIDDRSRKKKRSRHDTSLD
jgi:hypothetical protein